MSHGYAQLVLMPVSRAPHEVRLRWVQLQVVRCHPSHDVFHAGEPYVVWLTDTAVSHRRKSVSSLHVYLLHHQLQATLSASLTCLVGTGSNQCGHIDWSYRVWLATIADRSFRAAGSRLWNSLPSDVIDCHTVDTFRRRLKHFFLVFLFPDISIVFCV